MSADIYHTREVRDLAWACFSAPLIKSRPLSGVHQRLANCGLQLSSARANWLLELDRNPEKLHRHLSTLHNQRLGLYFESLWHFFLQQDPLVDLLAHNLAVRTPDKTVGEFDCLYFCHERQRHFHLELAVKYYLGRRSSASGEVASQWHEWLGPNNKDTLDRKITHLTQHQIKLSEHPAARAALRQLGIGELEKEIEIKGYLFQSQLDPLVAPNGFNESRTLSRWITIDELASFVRDDNCAGYSVLDKSHWLAAARSDSCQAPSMPAQSLITQLSNWFCGDTRAQLVAGFGADGAELRRFFVTAPNWPAQS